jgi:hypothetical protein
MIARLRGAQVSEVLKAQATHITDKQ